MYHTIDCTARIDASYGRLTDLLHVTYRPAGTAARYNNYMAFGAWGVGESCHESQWVYGVNNLYAYASAGGAAGGGPVIIHNEGPSPLGIRTFFYNDTFLLAADSTWCNAYGALNLVRSLKRAHTHRVAWGGKAYLYSSTHSLFGV
jgi:hypothetical protein